MLLVILVVCYALQVMAVVVHHFEGRGQKSEKEAGSLLSMFSASWARIGIGILAPIMLSIMATIGTTSVMGTSSSLVYPACLTTVIVLMTLDFSLFESLFEALDGEWILYIVSGWILDILCLLFLAWPVVMKVKALGDGGWRVVQGQVLLITIVAVISGSFTFFFAKSSLREVK